MTLPLIAMLALGAAPVLKGEIVYDGPGHLDDRCTGMVLSDDGAVYVSGFSLNPGTDHDFVTFRAGLDSIEWVKGYGSPLGSEDRLWVIASDGDDIVVAGGSIEERANGWDYIAIKYRPNGDTAWFRRIDFPPHADDKPVGLTVGPGGKVFLTGRSRNRVDSTRLGDWDIATVCLGPGGDTLWTRRYDGPAGRDDEGTGVAVDAQGNCYVVGKVTFEGPGCDVVLLKYAADGSVVWERRLAGEAPGNDVPAGVLLSADGSCLVFGALYNRGTTFDYFAACFDSAGERAWLRTVDGAGSVDIPERACFDTRGNLAVTGQSTGDGSSFDVLTVLFSASGDTVWTRRYNGDVNDADRGHCVAERGDGIVVGGTSIGRTGHPDMVLIEYSATGDAVWTYRRESEGPGETRPAVIACEEGAARNRMLVAGSTRAAGTATDILLLTFGSEE